MQTKKINQAIIIFVSLIISCTVVQAQERKIIYNPAMAYCNTMGYQYETRIDQQGNEHGVCIFPDNSECDAWDFFKGKAGNSFSYCAQNGFDVSTNEGKIRTYESECAVCISKSKDSSGTADKLVSSMIPMLELMEKNGQALVLEKPNSDHGQIISLKTTNDEQIDNVGKNTPLSLDWRNVFGHSFIGPVRDQGNCGSCYAFSALATAEGVYNVATGNFDENCADFSESYLMWCLGSLPEYYPHFYGCEGADWNYAELESLTSEGVVWEDQFPYTTEDAGGCVPGDDPTTVFSEWGRIPCGDIDAMKTAISTYGAIDVAVYASQDFINYRSGIFVDDNTSCNTDPCYMGNGTNHGVSLVGWGNDEISGDYWILRNSWGSSWGENGYMKIGTSSARITCEATYVSYVPGPPTANFSVPAPVVCAGSTVNIKNASTGELTNWMWTITPDNITFVNGTDRYSKNPEVQFDGGVYTITLHVENQYGSDTITNSDIITAISGQTVQLDVLFDGYPNETTWELRGTFLSGGPYSRAQQRHSEEFCLEAGYYTFVMQDSYGDGICCDSGNGHYSLTNLTTGETIYSSSGAFSKEEELVFGIFPICTTEKNKKHKMEGRAYYAKDGSKGRGYYAVGSDQYLGRGNNTVVQLKETSQGYFENGRCDQFPLSAVSTNKQHKKEGRAYKGKGNNGKGFYAVGSDDFLGKSAKAVTEVIETSMNFYKSTTHE